MSNNDRDTFGELRGKFDGSDSFMTGGHQIIKLRTGDRSTPEWARSDKRIRTILLRSFPKLKTNGNQRKRAARWATVIQLYHRTHMTRSQVADHMKLTKEQFKSLIRNINRAAKNVRTDGKSYSTRPPGRPKKAAPSRTSEGSSKIKG